MLENVGLYIHVPFCDRKCDYCDFYSYPGYSNDTSRYAAALRTHLMETAPLLRSGVNTIYFGGGTPALLGVTELQAIMKLVYKEFKVSQSSEITIELNPESTDKKLLTKLNRAGFNRLSLGVQSSVDSELRLLGRLHNYDRAKEAFEAARKAKFENISVDLMYGIGGQTLTSFEQTLHEIITLDPEHISCYGLKVEEGTPLYKRRATADLPSDDTQADMYNLACSTLAAAGYKHYEISNWAKPGYESRHNLKYWKLEQYLGFGPSAHSDYGGRRYSNISNINSYIEGIEQNGTVIDEIESISVSERAYEYIMLGLRISEGIDTHEYTQLFSLPADQIEAKLRRYEQDGFVRYDGRWSLTDSGFLLSNTILASLLG